MLGFSPLSSVPLSSLPATGAQAATGFVSGAFGTPLAAYARTQEAAGFLTGAVGDPRYVWRVDATSIAPTTTFGAPRLFPYAAVGFQNGAMFGTARLFPYHAVPINSTQFGLARLFPFHVAPGINGTQFGTLAGWQHWDVEWTTPKTRFGTPFITFNQTRIASGFTRGNFGTPLGTRVLPQNASRICIAQPVLPGHIGTPRLASSQAGTATGIQGGNFGASTARMTGFVASVSGGLLGTPTSLMAAHATGFRPCNIGEPSSRITQQATSLYLAPRWGQAVSDRSNTYKVAGIYRGPRLGHPTGAQRVNCTASGFTGGGLGSPTCRQRHLVTSMAPSCRIGAPLLRRNTICGIEGRASGLTGSRFGSPRLHGLHGVTGITSGAFGVPTA